MGQRTLFFLFGLLALTACQRPDAEDGGLRLGFFPNVNHAQALVGQADGTFARYQPEGRIRFLQFNAGPAAMEALLSGSVDATYVGTGPAINAYLKGGRTLRVIAGAADGGAMLVTREKWSVQQLRGKRLASPQLGNTQDIALRHWLGAQGLRSSAVGNAKADDVTILPLSNSDILSLYVRGQVDGAWVPEPWASRMLAAGGVVLVDERTLWPDGTFPSTVLVTTTDVLRKKPEAIAGLLRAHDSLSEAWTADPPRFARAVNSAYGKLTGKPLPDAVLERSFSSLTPSRVALSESLARAATQARSVGFLREENVVGMVLEHGRTDAHTRETPGESR